MGADETEGVLVVEGAVGKTPEEGGKVRLRGGEANAVEGEDGEHSKESYAFVAVCEGVVLHQSTTQAHCLFYRGGVELDTAK